MLAPVASPDPTAAASTPRLVPALGAISATALVVGAVIGSGVFFKPSQVARAAGDRLGLILALWVVCGLVNLCGALALAEMAAMFPHSGGTYVFLREAWGRWWSFLWAWAEFWVIRSGSIAALAVYSGLGLAHLAGQLGWASSAGAGSVQWLAIGCIVVIGLINAAGIVWGATAQNLMTAVKVATVAALALLPWAIPGGGTPRFGSWWESSAGSASWLGLGAALSAIMWAYDGWGNVTVVAEEVRHPQRNVPRALIGGVAVLIVLYLGANLAYHWVLPWERIAAGDSPAVALWEAAWPSRGAQWMNSLLLISTLGALNSNVLVGPRVLLAVGRDHAALQRLARVHPRFRTPLAAILTMCGWSVVLVLLGELSPVPDKPLCDVLTDYCVFGGSIFYLSAVLAVFVLRRRRPWAERPYRAWGYPLAPAVFVGFYALLLASMFWAQPAECAAGLLLIAAGAMCYAVLYGRRSGAG
jgi:APA family basic amino acid/polyamine antiporter